MISARENAEILRKHRMRIEGCITFEAYRDIQVEYINMLIERYEKEDEELVQAARDFIAEVDNG